MLTTNSVCFFLLALGIASSQKLGEPLPFGSTTDGPETTTTVPETTTLAPTTSTTPASTTSAPSPTTPPPAVEVGSWNVTEANVTCILTNMAIQLNVSYAIADSKTGFALLSVPANTSSASGACGNDTQNIKITWKTDGVDKDNVVAVTFSQNKTSKIYSISAIDVLIVPDSVHFPGAISNASINLKAAVDDKLPFAPLAMSYKCSPSHSYNLTNNSLIMLSQVQVEAFRTDNKAKFGAASDCQSIDSADIVPIAVGCTLAALVIIVLIAYLVGRRRTHAKGYLSM